MGYKNLLNRVCKLEHKLDHIEHKIIFEGGASGHMNHIYDYTDLTLKDIKDIITNLLSGKIEDVTEKLDGMNIQCTLNNNGQVVFVRNKGDLNSDIGGMLQDDVAAKWVGRENVAKVYLSAYDTITRVFNNMGKEFFNPDKNTKILANCECITAGKTNILMYASAQVDFHNLWVYTREDENSPWQKSDVITGGEKIKALDKACENIDGAQLTPRIIIKVTEKSESIRDTYIAQINAIFKEAGCSDASTIDNYKRARFNDLCNKKYKWITQSKEGQDALFARWLNDDKSTKLTALKKLYKDNIDDLTNADYKAIVAECMKPIDTFFGKFGNSIISLCDGMVNAGAESTVISALSDDLKEVVDKVKEVGSVEMNTKLTNQLNRLAELGNEMNASEGIVFKYGDRLMKCTGSFAAINQILGMRFQV